MLHGQLRSKFEYICQAIDGNVNMKFLKQSRGSTKPSASNEIKWRVVPFLRYWLFYKVHKYSLNPVLFLYYLFESKQYMYNHHLIHLTYLQNHVHLCYISIYLFCRTSSKKFYIFLYTHCLQPQLLSILMHYVL